VLAVGHGGLFRVVLPLVLTGVSPDFAAAHGMGHGDIVTAEWDGRAWRCVDWGGVRPR